MIEKPGGLDPPGFCFDREKLIPLHSPHKQVAQFTIGYSFPLRPELDGFELPLLRLRRRRLRRA